MFASAGNKNSTNFKINFLAVVTPTINGKIHKTLILINFITNTMAKNDSKSLFRKNFSENKKKIIDSSEVAVVEIKQCGFLF